MSKLVTRNVFIDTCAFKGANFAFSTGVLQGLASLAEEKRISVKLTDITVREIEANIDEMIDEAAEALGTCRTKGRVLRSIARFSPIFDRFDDTYLKRELRGQFAAFQRSCDTEIIATSAVPPETVFKRYFSKLAPFGSGKSKCEFPDAFVVEALQMWCDDRDDRMYLVTQDKGMQEACDTQDHRLMWLDSLARFIDMVLYADRGRDATYVRRQFAKHVNQVKAAVRAAFEKTSFHLADMDKQGEASLVGVSSLDLGDPSIVLLETDKAAVEVQVKAQCTIHVEEWPHHVFRDGYVFWQHGPHTIDREISVPVQMSLRFSTQAPDELAIEDVRVNDGSSIGAFLDEPSHP